MHQGIRRKEVHTIEKEVEVIYIKKRRKNKVAIKRQDKAADKAKRYVISYREIAIIIKLGNKSPRQLAALQNKAKKIAMQFHNILSIVCNEEGLQTSEYEGG